MCVQFLTLTLPIIMLILIVSFGNFLVIQLTTLVVLTLSDPEAFPTIRAFLNNIPLIPVSTIYFMMMLGVDKPVYAKRTPW